MAEEMSETSGLSRVLSRFVWIILSPRHVFADIEAGRAPWWQPWIVVSALSMIGAWVFHPVTIAIVRLNPRGLPEDQIEQMVVNIEKLKWLGVVGAPLQMLVVTLLFALLGYLVVAILSDHSNFKKYFTLYLYAWIPLTIGTTASMILSKMKLESLGEVRSLGEVMVSFGPIALFDPENKVLKAFLGSFDLFAVWSFVLVGMGVIHIFKLSRQMMYAVLVAVWIPVFLQSLIGALFGG